MLGMWCCGVNGNGWKFGKFCCCCCDKCWGVYGNEFNRFTLITCCCCGKDFYYDWLLLLFCKTCTFPWPPGYITIIGDKSCFLCNIDGCCPCINNCCCWRISSYMALAYYKVIWQIGRWSIFCIFFNREKERTLLIYLVRGFFKFIYLLLIYVNDD